MLGSLLLEEFFLFLLPVSVPFSSSHRLENVPFLCTLNLLVGYILGECRFVFFFPKETMHN